METAKIALFLPDIADGGAERVLLSLADNFRKRGYDVDLVLGKAGGPYMASVPPGVRVVDLDARRMLRSIVPLIKYLRRERPTALLATQIHVVLCAILAKMFACVPVRLVLREANTLSVDCRENRTLKWRLTFLAAKYFYRFADAIIAVSRGVAADLQEHIAAGQDKIIKINNPVALDAIAAKAEEEPGGAWFYANMAPVVIGVGRLTKQKDFATLIKAFAIVRRRRAAKLLIIGEGEDRQELEQLAAGLGLTGDVLLPGFVVNPFACLARAAVFVLSSAWEGFPNVLVQAMACGTPVVATDCPSGPDEILEAGKYGPLVPIGDAEAMAAAIEAALDEPVSAEALRRKCREYNETDIAEQYLAVLLPPR